MSSARSILGTALPAAPVLGAAAGALLLTPMRSLPACLIGGLAGYGLGRLLF